MLLLVLMLPLPLLAQEMFFGKTVTPVLSHKIAFWKRMYGEIDSSKTVIFNKRTLQTYAVVPNGEANRVIDSVRKRGENQKSITSKQGRKEFVREAIYRADNYWFIVDSLAAHHLHADLRWLPVLESGYLDTMVSDQNAHGIWQFIPSTAQQYGLAENESADTHLSTGAFIRYFSALYHEFGDYGVALTAYHHGEGGVQRKLKRRKSASLESIIPDLGFQSGNYYAKYLAIVQLAHGMQRDTLPAKVKPSQ